MMRVDESCNSHSRLITSSILNWFKLWWELMRVWSFGQS
jgi:hypothetical protein